MCGQICRNLVARAHQKASKKDGPLPGYRLKQSLGGDRGGGKLKRGGSFSCSIRWRRQKGGCFLYQISMWVHLRCGSFKEDENNEKLYVVESMRPCGCFCCMQVLLYGVSQMWVLLVWALLYVGACCIGSPVCGFSVCGGLSRR